MNNVLSLQTLELGTPDARCSSSNVSCTSTASCPSRRSKVKIVNAE